MQTVAYVLIPVGLVVLGGAIVAMLTEPGRRKKRVSGEASADVAPATDALVFRGSVDLEVPYDQPMRDLFAEPGER